MFKISKYLCVGASCLLCGILGAAGNTMGDAARRFHVVARLIVLFIFMVFSLVAWAMFNLPTWIDSAHYIDYLPNFVGCAANATAETIPHTLTLSEWLLVHEFGTSTLGVPERLCFGSISAFRVMGALSIYHLLFALFTLGADRRPTSLRSTIQHGWWSIKLVLLAFILGFVFFGISNDIIVVYSWVAIVGSIIFVLVQILLFIEFAYVLNGQIAQRYNTLASTGRAGKCAMGTGTLFVVVLSYVATAALIIMSYGSTTMECTGVITGITGTLLLAIFSTIGSFLAHRSSRGGLLPSAIVTFYAAYLTWSAMSPMALHAMDCNPHVNENSAVFYMAGLAGIHDMSKGAQEIILLASALFALGYSVFRVSSAMSTEQAESNVQVGVMYTEEEDEEEGMKEERGQGGGDLIPYSYSRFHAIFFLATMYAAAVINGWNPLYFHLPEHVQHGVTIFVNHTATTLWVKLGSAYLLLLLFTWTVYAPLCCHRKHTNRTQKL